MLSEIKSLTVSGMQKINTFKGVPKTRNYNNKIEFALDFLHFLLWRRCACAAAEEILQSHGRPNKKRLGSF
jgi:hypothetical protein